MNEDRFFRLKELGYGATGSLDGKLILEKSAPNNRLKARINVIRQDNGTYEGISELYADDCKCIQRFKFAGKKSYVFDGIDMVINGFFEPCFSGNTNTEDLKKIHKQYLR